MPVNRSDVIIVGGGIVGCATAYYLARRGASVRLLERGSIGSEQSGRAWGFIRQQGRHPAEVPLAARAARLWQGLEQELQADLEYVREGIVVAAETREDEQRLEESLSVAKANQLDSRMLTGEETTALAPGSARRWLAGLFTPSDGHAEPIRVTSAFAEASRKIGVDIVEEMPVLGLETTGGSVAGVVTAKHRYEAAAVVCATGIGSADLAKTVGVSLPIMVVRAPASQTNRAAPTSRVPFWSPQVAFRPRRDGSYYIGNGFREIDAEIDLTLDVLQNGLRFVPTFLANRSVIKLRLGQPFLEDLARRLTTGKRFRPWPETPVNSGLVQHNWRQFLNVFPHYADLGLARSWAGRIDVTPDLIPIIGPVDGVANYYIAAGFSGHGFALGPLVGKILSEWVLDGSPSMDLHAFRFARFAAGEGTPNRSSL